MIMLCSVYNSIAGEYDSPEEVFDWNNIIIEELELMNRTKKIKKDRYRKIDRHI